MNPRSSSGPETDPDGAVGSTVAGEVTRVEEVKYLAGGSGHAVFSLGFLFGGIVLVRVGVWGSGVTMVAVAYGIALHGLSVYGWDRLRVRFASALRNRDDGPSTRSLTPHSVSLETKTDLLAGLTMMVGLVAGLLVGLAALRTVGVRPTVYLSAGALALGDVGVLARAYHVNARA